jgi:hypothetical protein
MRNKIYLDRESLQLLLERNPELEVAFTQCAENWIKKHELRPLELEPVRKIIKEKTKEVQEEINKQYDKLTGWSTCYIDSTLKDEIKEKVKRTLDLHIKRCIELRISEIVNEELNITTDTVNNLIDKLTFYAKSNLDKYLSEEMVKNMLAEVLKEKFGSLLN